MATARPRYWQHSTMSVTSAIANTRKIPILLTIRSNEECSMKVRPLKDRDRSIEIQEALDTVVMNIESRMKAQGFGTEEVLDALNTVVLARWKLYDEDPDVA